VSRLTLVHATSARLHRQLLGSGHVGISTREGAEICVAPLVCDSLDATAAGLKNRLVRKSRGEPGGEDEWSRANSESVAQECVWVWVCVCGFTRGVVVSSVKGEGVVGKRAEQGSVPRMTGLRMLKEPASSKEVRHGGWMF
jgi:hypothetical protein